MSKTSDDAGKGRWWPWLLGIISVWGGVTFFIFPRLVGDVEVRGQWGDSFGMINALFAGLALAGVIYAIILQREELQLQREELEKTREEIKGQKEQLEAQNQTLQKQNFESSFFQLLGLHNDIVNSMAVESSFFVGMEPTVYQGRQCFGFMLKEFRGNYAEYKEDEENFYAGWEESPDEVKQLELRIDKKYEELFDRYQHRVGYYFRTLYNFVKFVDEEKDFPKDYEAKKFYTNLIRAQLSSDELGLLFYNCLSERGAKFKCLVEKYELLEDMDFKVLINEEHKKLYDKRAYGESA